jgi:hypothetical protein
MPCHTQTGATLRRSATKVNPFPGPFILILNTPGRSPASATIPSEIRMEQTVSPARGRVDSDSMPALILAAV